MTAGNTVILYLLFSCFIFLNVTALTQTTRSQFLATLLLSTPAMAEEQRLQFTTLDTGVRIADIRIQPSSSSVQPTSKVNVHLTGRLLGKNGWIFEDSQADGEPYRLQLGNGSVIQGLQDGLVGMTEGSRRRIVVPSSQGYVNKQLEPIPRDFGNRQRLYTTVMNSVRVDRERSQLGSDLAGMVVLDVEILRIR